MSSVEKRVTCPHCQRYWITSRKGGGMVAAGAYKHIKACKKKHEDSK